jgi:alkanesulfonate monooxygenase SsuD/methylene tetrahydromethanopterin reductase-like flavin-dependent oxidoreductase (luciferase family)
MQRARFDHDAGPEGSLYVGSPETVARKIASTARALNLTRFDMKYSAGRLPTQNLCGASSCTESK